MSTMAQHYGYFSDDESVQTEVTAEMTNQSWFADDDDDDDSNSIYDNGDIHVFMVYEREEPRERIASASECLSDSSSNDGDDYDNILARIAYKHNKPREVNIPAREYLSDSDSDDDDECCLHVHNVCERVAKENSESPLASSWINEYISDSESDDEDDDGGGDGDDDNNNNSSNDNDNDNDECRALNLPESFLAQLIAISERGSSAARVSDSSSDDENSLGMDILENSLVISNSHDDGNLLRYWCFQPISRIELPTFDVLEDGKGVESLRDRSGGLWVVHSMPLEDLKFWTGSEEYKAALELEKDKLRWEYEQESPSESSIDLMAIENFEQQIWWCELWANN